ncbi:MAG: PQQ-binding-like beta-propeller repeat protein [Pseudomonadota bacterium]|nr:PQQ-binding-like beta-propeller repeat protein [Pseudomonadota bacterium]
MPTAVPARLLSMLLPAMVLLSGCDQARAPAEVHEVARQGVYSATLSHDGSEILVGSIHHGGSLWTTSPTERIYDWNHSSEGYSNIISAAFSPEGNYVATTDNRTIVLWQRQSGEAVWYWNAPGNIEDIALTADGDYALLGMQDFTATLFDIKNGGIRQRLAHDGIVYDVSLSDDGLLAATASADLNARLWNPENGRLIRTLPHDNQVRTAQLSADGRLLFTSALNEPGRIWDAASGKLLHEIDKTRGHYSAARFAPGNRQLLTGNSSGEIELWDVSSGKRTQVWRAKPRDTWVSNNVLVEDVAFLGNHWVAAGTNGLMYILE